MMTLGTRLGTLLALCSLLFALGLRTPHPTSAGRGSSKPIPTSTSGPGGGGGGATPSISFSPTALNFGSQANGTTSAAQTVTATNTGTANLFFNNVAESGSFGLDYTIVDDGCIGLTLTPGQSCQTSVT